MAVEWEKIATEGMLKFSTLYVPLYLSQKNAGSIDDTGISLFRPVALPEDDNVPQLHFSSTDSGSASTSEDNDIKRYSYSEISSGSDSHTTWFDLKVGSMAGYEDGSGNPTDSENLIEDVMGCAFMVPQGDSSVAEHEFEINLLMSQESGSDADDSDAKIHVTLWKADVGNQVNMNTGNSTIRFRLAKKTLLTPSGGAVQLPDADGTTKHQSTQTFYVPLAYSASDDWTDRMCYYILGCWVEGGDGSNSLTPSASAISWPLTDNSGNCSIKAFVSVTYQQSR